MKTQLEIELDPATFQSVLEKYLADNVFKTPVQVTCASINFPSSIPAPIGTLPSGIKLTVVIDQP